MPIRLTKILATLGPATGSKKQIRSLARAGVNVFRLNLSHGSHDDVRQWIHWIREVEEERGAFIGILFDLQGPKMRIGRFENGSIPLRRGQRIVFTTEAVVGNEELVPVQYRHFHKEVGPGSRVFLDDGTMVMEVIGVSGKRVEVQVKVGGTLSDHKGLNLPDATTTQPALTPKDKKDLRFGLKEGVDFVALSFVGSAGDIRQLRRMMGLSAKDVAIIAKIERRQAVDHLEEIIEASDGVMVARGDLGIEIPLAEVPVVQQRILREAALRSRPVIIATQMLESMITHPRPTRAEVSDISNSVWFCADAIMLSAETAVGKHARAAVEVMVETVKKTEAFQRKVQRIPPWHWVFKDPPPIPLGVTYSANRMVELLGARAIIVFTLTGGTARMVASPHPTVPVFAFTSRKQRARGLSLLRGTVPFLVDGDKNFLEDLKAIFRLLKKKRLLKKDDRVVIAAGMPFDVPQWTNLIRVEVVP